MRANPFCISAKRRVRSFLLGPRPQSLLSPRGQNCLQCLFFLFSRLLTLLILIKKKFIVGKIFLKKRTLAIYKKNYVFLKLEKLVIKKIKKITYEY